MTIEQRFVNNVPELWKSWFLKHIRMEKDNQLPSFAGVYMDNKQIKMVINETLSSMLSDKDITNLIIHEVAHIIRGDILVDRTNMNFEIANIAMDSIINTNINVEEIGGIKGVTIKSLQELDFPVPDQPMSWRIVYDIIMERMLEINLKSYDIILSPKGDYNENKDALDDMILDLIECDAQIINKISFNNNLNKRKISVTITTSTVLENIIRNIVSYAGKRQKKRTYRRENHLDDSLKGISRIPLNKVLVVADISGSYTHYTSIIIGLFYWLSKKNIVAHFGTFSDDFYLYKNNVNLNELRGYGGFTQIKGMFNYLQKESYDLVVVFTDGEIFDYNKKLRQQYPGKIIWVLETNHNLKLYDSKDVILYNDKVLKK